MNHQCRFCDCLYPADSQCCPVCTEPNPLWEKREALRLLEENMGDEAAWTGVPKAFDFSAEGDLMRMIRNSFKQNY